MKLHLDLPEPLAAQLRIKFAALQRHVGEQGQRLGSKKIQSRDAENHYNKELRIHRTNINMLTLANFSRMLVELGLSALPPDEERIFADLRNNGIPRGRRRAA